METANIVIAAMLIISGCGSPTTQPMSNVNVHEESAEAPEQQGAVTLKQSAERDETARKQPFVTDDLVKNVAQDKPQPALRLEPNLPRQGKQAPGHKRLQPGCPSLAD